MQHSLHFRFKLTPLPKPPVRPGDFYQEDFPNPSGEAHPSRPIIPLLPNSAACKQIEKKHLAPSKPQTRKFPYLSPAFQKQTRSNKVENSTMHKNIFIFSIIIALFLFLSNPKSHAMQDRKQLRKQWEQSYDSCRNAMDDSGLEITGYLSLAHRILELGNLLDNTEIMAFGYLELSRGTLMLKKYDLCLQYVYKAIDLSQELDHDEQVADAQRIAGAAYLALNNTELAYSYLDKAYQYYLSANDTTKRLQTLSEMAIMYSYEQQYEKCIDLYNDVLYLSGKQKWQSMQLVTLLNMARTYTNAGETDLALNTLDRIRHGIPDSLFNEVYRMAYLLNRGELLLSKGRLQEAEEDLQNGFQMAKASGDMDAILSSLRSLAEIGLAQKDYDLLASCYRSIALYQDSLDQLIDRKNIYEMEFLQNLTQKDKQIEEAHSKIHTYKIIIPIILAGCLIFIILYRRNKIRARQNQQGMEKLSEELQTKEEKINDTAVYFHEMRNIVSSVIAQLKEAEKNIPSEKENQTIRKSCQQLNEIISENSSFFNNLIDVEYGDFLKKISKRYPNLSTTEKRVCAMLSSNFSSKEIASVLNCSDRSLNNTRSRIRKKLGIPEGSSLSEFLKNIA